MTSPSPSFVLPDPAARDAVAARILAELENGTEIDSPKAAREIATRFDCTIGLVFAASYEVLRPGGHVRVDAADGFGQLWRRPTQGELFG